MSRSVTVSSIQKQCLVERSLLLAICESNGVPIAASWVRKSPNEWPGPAIPGGHLSNLTTVFYLVLVVYLEELLSLAPGPDN